MEISKVSYNSSLLTTLGQTTDRTMGTAFADSLSAAMDDSKSSTDKSTTVEPKNTIENICNWLCYGSSRYEEPDGRKRTTGEVVMTEVEFLDKKQSSDAGRPGDDISQETLNSTVMCGFGPCTVFDEREFGDEIPVSGI